MRASELRGSLWWTDDGLEGAGRAVGGGRDRLMMVVHPRTAPPRILFILPCCKFSFGVHLLKSHSDSTSAFSSIELWVGQRRPCARAIPTRLTSGTESGRSYNDICTSAAVRHQHPKCGRGSVRLSRPKQTPADSPRRPSLLLLLSAKPQSPHLAKMKLATPPQPTNLSRRARAPQQPDSRAQRKPRCRRCPRARPLTSPPPPPGRPIRVGHGIAVARLPSRQPRCTRSKPPRRSCATTPP